MRCLYISVYLHLSGKPGKYLQQSHTPQCLLVLLMVFYLRFVIFWQLLIVLVTRAAELLLIVLVTRAAEFREALPISGAYSNVVGGMTGAADRLVDRSSCGVARHSLFDSVCVSVQVSTAVCPSVTEGRAEVLFTA